MQIATRYPYRRASDVSIELAKKCLAHYKHMHFYVNGSPVRESTQRVRQKQLSAADSFTHIHMNGC